jgi:hypothetical protein
MSFFGKYKCFINNKEGKSSDDGGYPSFILLTARI